MTIQTRGSAALDKAERRLAGLKSIQENLDLGYGLTVAAYSQLIDSTRAALEAHNTLLSHVEESRRTLTEMEQTLSTLSARMLTGVATKYGKTSLQYSKVGGKVRKGARLSDASLMDASLTMIPMVMTTSNGTMNGTAS